MKSNTQVSNTTNQVKHEARRAATSKWMVIFARLGYAIKGVVYLIIGILAVQVAIGVGGKTTDQNGAIQTISHLPLGGFLLIVVTIGLFGFAIWSFIQAIFDTEGKGRDAKGIVSRIGYAAVGIGYAAIGYATLRIVIGSASGGTNSTTRTQDVTATLLKLPLGPALVVIAAIVVLCIAGYLFYKAYSAKFQQRLALSGLGARMRSFAIGLGRLGYAALGLVFTVISIFLIVAAVQHNPDRAVGLDGSLHELALQPFGKLLLGVVALGLIAYGAYSFVEARYRRIG
jgi:Domain of Unknown Function (DUF1206)